MSAVKPALYRVKDAAVRTSLSEWEIRRLLNIGVLERRYVGEGSRYYRVTAESVERYLETLPSEPAVRCRSNEAKDHAHGRAR